MFKKISIGIDPGSSSGGIAFIYSLNSGKHEVTLYAFNKVTERQLSDIVRHVIDINVPIFCIIEKVWAFPGQGVSSVFKFGQNYGFLRGLLIALNIAFNETTPRTWIKYYGMKKNKTESKIQWKKRLRGKAEQLFPNVKITTNTSDALLIANYCRLLF